LLKTENVYLAPLTSDDVPTLFKWINNRDLVLLNASYKPISQSEHLQWFTQIHDRQDVNIFAIRLVENNQLIGSCQLRNIHLLHRNAELQIRIGENINRGKGYGSEALQLLLHFGFTDLNLQRIYLHVFATNEIAIKAYQKVGFIHEGLLRKAAFVDGEYVDILVMSVLQNE